MNCIEKMDLPSKHSYSKTKFSTNFICSIKRVESLIKGYGRQNKKPSINLIYRRLLSFEK